MKRIRQSAAFIILLFFFKVIFAALQSQDYSDFDVPKATLQLEAIHHQLSTKNVNYEQLYSAVKIIHSLQEQANNCVENGKIQLKKINELLSSNEISSMLMKQNDLRYQELLHDKNIKVKETAECVFFNYQAQELLNEINTRMANTRMFSLLIKSPPIWDKLDPKQFFTIAIQKDKLYQASGISRLNKNDLIIIGLIFGVGLLFSLVFNSIYKRSIKNRKGKFTSKLLIAVSQSGLFLFLALLLADIYLHGVFTNALPRPSLLLLFDALLSYALIITVMRFSLALLRQYVSHVSERLIDDINIRATLFITLLFLGHLAAIVIQEQWIHPVLLGFRFLLFSTLLILSFAWLSWLIFRLDFFKVIPGIVLQIIKFLLIGVYAFTIVMAWLGYSNFAVYFIPNIIITLLIFAIIWKVSHLLGKLFSLFDNPGNPASEKIHTWLGLKSNQPLIELFTIRIILNIGFIIFSMFVLMKIWGVSQYYIDYLRTWYFKGGYVYGLYIWPMRIVRAAIAFCLLLMLGRALATYAARHSAFKGEKYRQDNVGTLINYSAFSIALVIALLIAGINFTSLAVIAGALSIGIGFGLQYLASDFVSGIILLIHKPVTPGDRVVIDNTEGYIKKIRLLSTQITTLSHADVIIPNSHLINKSVTNYTYRDNKICRINSQVILDSSSDLELAERVLLNVVKKNPHIVQEPPYNATVSYELVPAKDSLHVIVDLWYYIKDIDLKQNISSEISFNVVKALKEYNLCPGQKIETK
ncbi:mechanosensitive ion channel family protein [Legionella brunensis]|uniref:Potassium efflux system KefA n=1 Tax=Legionella brunensis TaxID=29422 RepID=A0A0W0SSZ3_9GAMM|nr:mechanosensitive ion channel domain-containing protein [Legionella brunensis]KTC86329.1 potassium efflux system KefA [Legionella brunensis]